MRAVERPIPGRPRPAKVAIAEYEKDRSEARARWKPEFLALFRFYWPEVHGMHRWRLQLECDCIHEVYYRSPDKPPLKWMGGAAYPPQQLPDGEYECRNHGLVFDRHYREITEWISSEPDRFEPDEDDPPGSVAKDKLKWQVRLSCGHISRQWTKPDFDPSIGPQPTIRPEEIPAKRARWQGVANSDEEHEHYMRMADKGWPKPFPEVDCWTCCWARKIVAYEALGPLIEPPPAPRKVRKPSAATAERARRKRIKELEVELAELKAASPKGE